MVITDREGNVMRVANIDELDNAIAELKVKKELQENQIHDSFDNLKEGLKPINLLKSAVHKVTKTNTPLELGLKVGGTIVAALIAKKVFSHKEDEDDEVKHVVVKEDKSAVSTFAQGMITNFLVTNIPTITAYASAIFHNVFQHDEEEEQEQIGE